MIGYNAYVANLKDYFPVIEIFEMKDGATPRDAERIAIARHVEILGPSWIHHDPQAPLGSNTRRSSVLATESALRIFEDTDAQKATQAKAVPYGCGQPTY